MALSARVRCHGFHTGRRSIRRGCGARPSALSSTSAIPRAKGRTGLGNEFLQSLHELVDESVQLGGQRGRGFGHRLGSARLASAFTSCAALPRRIRARTGAARSSARRPGIERTRKIVVPRNAQGKHRGVVLEGVHGDVQPRLGATTSSSAIGGSSFHALVGHYQWPARQANPNSAATRSPSAPARPSTCLARMAQVAPHVRSLTLSISGGTRRQSRGTSQPSPGAPRASKAAGLGHHPGGGLVKCPRPFFSRSWAWATRAADPQAAVPVNAAACPACRAQKPPVGYTLSCRLL